MDPVPVIAVFIGGVICFFGFQMITSAIRVWGFVVGGAFAAIVAVSFLHVPGSLTHLTPQMGIAFAIGGVIGAIIAGPLSLVIIFISGMALGAAMGSYGYPLVSRGQENFVLTVILSMVTGLLAARFQEIVMIVTTAFVGALMMAYGARTLAGLEMLPVVGIFFVLGFFGAATQYKTAHPDISWL